MGIILGALGGAGAALQDIGAARMKADMAQDAQTNESSLATQRAQALAMFQENLKNAPLSRLSLKAKEFAGQEVPQEAAPVTELTGTDENGKTFGLTGNLAELRKRAMSWPDSATEKAGFLAQLDRQEAIEAQKNKGIVAGQMRKRTSEEALQAAADDAKTNDLTAYAAYESQIGKPAREDRKIDINEKKAELAAAASARESVRKNNESDRRDETQRYLAQLRADTSENNTQARIEALIKTHGSDKNSTKEALSFIDGVRKDLADESSKLKALYASDTKDQFGSKLAAIKDQYKPKFAAIETKRNQIEQDFNALREKVGLPSRPASTDIPAPAASGAPSAKPPANRPPLSSFQK